MTTLSTPESSPDDATDGERFGLLLVQLGFHTACRFAEAIAPLGLEPRHVGLLRQVAAHQGRSQQALGELLGLTPTRMVFLIDDLEERGLVKRRRNAADRRSYALCLTARGRRALERAEAASRRQDTDLGESLTPAERKELARLLRTVAGEQGVSPDRLPGPGGPACDTTL